jgi:hypothetical protein
LAEKKRKINERLRRLAPVIIAEHEFVEAGWHWRYELDPNRLTLIGLRGEERQEFEMKPNHASPNPDRWMEEYGYRSPVWLWAPALAIIVSTFLPCGFVMTVADGVGRVVPPMWVPNILTVTIVAIALEILGLCLIPRIFGIKHFRRAVRYKRLSDGGEIIRFTSVLNPTGYAFEEFVSEVSAAIAESRQDPEPPPSDAFKAMF